MLYFPSMNIYDQIKVSATNTKFKDDKMSHSRPMIGCMRSEDVFTHRRICFLLVPTVGVLVPTVPPVPTVGAHLTLNRTNCRLFWAPKAFLAPDPGHGHSRNTSHLSEDQLCHNLAMVRTEGGIICCCNHHRHCS